ncbi:MAG: glycosyltransferase [Muribaculaceae bacterium]|nr:glycosyltransferase [Muribaculaceae bacterium]
MKVTLVNHSDTLGGASVVTYRLMEALRQHGVDARMIVVRKATADTGVALAGQMLTRKACFIAEHARIFAATGFSRENLFKISIATDGLALSRHQWIQDADAVLLNWVNQGMLSLDEIERIAFLKPVVWTMHDMWCMTGVCHHAESCTNYIHECGNCPLIKNGRNAGDLSHTTWKRKKKLYTSASIHFVAVSNWLAEKCACSSLLSAARVSVIPNAFPVGAFSPVSERPSAIKRIVMGAARLDDPIKDLPLAVASLNQVAERYEGNAEAVFFGEIRNPEYLKELRLPFRHIGTVNGSNALAALYRDAKVVLSTSRYETLPGTIVEGMASGCVAVATGNGGQRDIIDHMHTGYIADLGTPEDVANGIMWALDADIDPYRQHQAIAARFSSDCVAQKYIELINKLIRHD